MKNILVTFVIDSSEALTIRLTPRSVRVNQNPSKLPSARPRGGRPTLLGHCSAQNGGCSSLSDFNEIKTLQEDERWATNAKLICRKVQGTQVQPHQPQKHLWYVPVPPQNQNVTLGLIELELGSKSRLKSSVTTLDITLFNLTSNSQTTELPEWFFIHKNCQQNTIW